MAPEAFTSGRCRPPARGGPIGVHFRPPQATRKGWPYYIRPLHRRHDRRVYSRATPCGWPAARSHGLQRTLLGMALLYYGYSWGLRRASLHPLHYIALRFILNLDFLRAGGAGFGFDAGDFPVRGLALAPEVQVEFAFADAQVLERQVWQPFRQRWVDVELAVRGIGAQAEHRAYHVEDAACRPCLRDIGPAGIEDRETGDVAHPGDAGVQLWRSERVEEFDGLELGVDDLVSLVHQPVAFETGGDDAVIVRPDGTKLVIVWVVGRVLAGKRADAPAVPHVFLQQPSGRADRLILIGDA